jgi:hypothetical protein
MTNTVASDARDREASGVREAQAKLAKEQGGVPRNAANDPNNRNGDVDSRTGEPVGTEFVDRPSNLTLDEFGEPLHPYREDYDPSVDRDPRGPYDTNVSNTVIPEGSTDPQSKTKGHGVQRGGTGTGEGVELSEKHIYDVIGDPPGRVSKQGAERDRQGRRKSDPNYDEDNLPYEESKNKNSK